MFWIFQTLLKKQLQQKRTQAFKHHTLINIWENNNVFLTKLKKRIVKNEERVKSSGKFFACLFLFFWKLKPWDRSGSEDSPNTLLDKVP